MKHVHRLPAVETRSAAVDFLTITAVDTGVKTALCERALKTSAILEEFGEQRKSWHWRGYSGFRTGGMAYGERQDSAIAMLSGIDCQAFWSIFAPHSTNCTRVDLAVTIRLKKCSPRLLENYVKWAREEGSPALRRLTSVTSGDGTGKTLYVGSRSSDQFGRVYDKGAQIKNPLEIHRLYRYEVEFKRDRAALVLGELIGSKQPEERARLIGQTVFTWFDNRGIPPVFGKFGDGSIPLELSARITSASRKLTWLRKQVRPTVRWLLEATGERDVLWALGLDEMYKELDRTV
jgi:DNA relaxase NicK